MQRLVALKVATDDQGPSRKRWPSSTTITSSASIDQRTLPDRKLRLLYMQYIAGGTLQAVIQRVRQTPPEERTGKLILDVDRRSARTTGRIAAERIVAAGLDWRPRPGPKPSAGWGRRSPGRSTTRIGCGVLHRDVKPANVLVTAEGSPKLADFNISFSAKVTGATPDGVFRRQPGLHVARAARGVQAERLRTGPEELDGRSDLYSLGIVLWELLTGFRPFRDEGGQGRLVGHLGPHGRTAARGRSTRGRWPSCPDVPKACRRSWRRRSPRSQPALVERPATWLVAWSCAPTPRRASCLFPPRKSFRVRLRKYAVLIVFVAAGLPNVLGGVFNYVHNSSEIVSKLGPMLPLFERTQTAINGVAYPVGAVLFWYLGFSVYRGLKQCQAGQLEPDRGRRLRHRCLELGRLVALVSVCGMGDRRLRVSDQPATGQRTAARLGDAPVFLFAALVRAGGGGVSVFRRHVVLAASLYPVFLLADFNRAAADAPFLRQMQRRNAIYLVVAALGPLLAIAALVADSLINDDVLPPGAEKSMAIFSIVGLLGLPCLFWLSHLIRQDLTTLSGIVVAEE